MSGQVCLICHEGLPRDLDKVLEHIGQNHPEVKLEQQTRKQRAITKVEMKYGDHIIHPEVRTNGTTKKNY